MLQPALFRMPIRLPPQAAESRGQARIDSRTLLCDTANVKGGEFLRKLGRLAHRRGSPLCLRAVGGQGGSHGRIYLGGEITTLKDPKMEIRKGLLRATCSDPGIEPQDL
jgi:hypothetical protein